MVNPSQNESCSWCGFYFDRLSTAIVLATDQSGQEVWRWQSDAFGDGLATSAPNSGLNAINLRFPGQYYDSESGLYYNYFRDYDPQTGRYVQSDPIGLGGGWNTYSYVGGNPISYIDPLGLATNTNQRRQYYENFPTGARGIVCALGLGLCPTDDPKLYRCLMARCTPECGNPFIIDNRSGGTHMFDPKTTRCECVLKGFNPSYNGGPPPGL